MAEVSESRCDDGARGTWYGWAIAGHRTYRVHPFESPAQRDAFVGAVAKTFAGEIVPPCPEWLERLAAFHALAFWGESETAQDVGNGLVRELVQEEVPSASSDVVIEGLEEISLDPNGYPEAEPEPGPTDRGYTPISVVELRDSASRIGPDRAAEIATRDPNWRVRWGATVLVGDQAVLEQVARNDPHEVIRMSTAGRLFEEATLRGIEANDENPDVRHAARERLDALGLTSPRFNLPCPRMCVRSDGRSR